MATAEARGETAPTRSRAPIRRRDVIVAGATALAALALLVAAPTLAEGDPSTDSLAFPQAWSAAWWITAAVLLVQAVVLTVARVAPRTAVVVVAALAVVPAVVVPPSLHGDGGLAVMVAVVVAVLATPLAGLWPALALAALLVAAGETTAAVVADATGAVGGIGQGLVQGVGVVGLPLLGALVAKSRIEVRRAQRQEQSALVRERDALVDVAVARERAAMARELHDIAAHHLSGIALMAGVVDRQIDTDPERAHDGVRQMRAQSTSVLDDLRRLVGLLRDDSAATLAVETVAAIPDLVARSPRRAAIDLRVLEDDVRPLGSGIGPLAQLAAYRTVQEALSNAAMHAPDARCVVELDDRDADRLTVRVTNGPSAHTASADAPSGGFGLRGMRERAELVGSDLTVGPTEGGGWQVVLMVGREAPPAADDTDPGGQVVA
ncbi:histidine kinase [Curtobacterium sp. ISL-83]|uniref:sensor histidine kinase n=1 Tax=Curtobacterium sp. ISL-83 TaxID=2819145 RepID=UPI001BEB4045|nr:histidine kinase [Curtobacterium sp. ISL-83]MBT2503742.1 hypothetical protein [Curtobacterium sp. ISL-83]